MKRREALCLVGGLTSSALVPMDLHSNSSKAENWIPAFSKRWDVAVDYSLKILDSMPESDTDFQPIPEQRSFWQQFTHTAYWNSFYIASITGATPPEEPKSPNKESARAYFIQTSEEVSSLLASLKESDLYLKSDKGNHIWGKGADYWKEHTAMDFLLRAYMHTTHHRAQAIVYLRLKGIKPPFFQF